MKIIFEGTEYDLDEKVECGECGRKFFLSDAGAEEAEEFGIMCGSCIVEEMKERDDFDSGHGPELMGKM